MLGMPEFVDEIFRVFDVGDRREIDDIADEGQHVYLLLPGGFEDVYEGRFLGDGVAVRVVVVVTMVETLAHSRADFDPVRVALVDHSQVQITENKRFHRLSEPFYPDGDPVAFPLVCYSHETSSIR